MYRQMWTNKCNELVYTKCPNTTPMHNGQYNMETNSRIKNCLYVMVTSLRGRASLAHLCSRNEDPVLVLFETRWGMLIFERLRCWHQNKGVQCLCPCWTFKEAFICICDVFKSNKHVLCKSMYSFIANHKKNPTKNDCIVRIYFILFTRSFWQGFLFPLVRCYTLKLKNPDCIWG